MVLSHQFVAFVVFVVMVFRKKKILICMLKINDFKELQAMRVITRHITYYSSVNKTHKKHNYLLYERQSVIISTRDKSFGGIDF